MQIDDDGKMTEMGRACRFWRVERKTEDEKKKKEREAKEVRAGKAIVWAGRITPAYKGQSLKLLQMLSHQLLVLEKLIVL